MARVTAYHNPQGMVNYNPIPFRDIASIGQDLRKTSDEAFKQASALENIDVNALEVDRMRREQILGDIESKTANIYDTHKLNPRQALEESRRLGTAINKNKTRGELAAIENRYKQFHDIDKNLQETYLDSKSKNYNPQAYNYYKSKIGIPDLGYQGDTGLYGNIEAPTTHKLYSPEALTKHYDVVLGNINSDQILSEEGLKRYGTGIPFKQLLETPGAEEYIDFNKVGNALVGATSQDIRESAEVQGLMRGMEGQGRFMNDDGSFDLRTDLGRMLSGFAGGKAFSKQRRGSVKTLSDSFGEWKAKQEFEGSQIPSSLNLPVTSKDGVTAELDELKFDANGQIKSDLGGDPTVKGAKFLMDAISTGDWSMTNQEDNKRARQTAQLNNWALTNGLDGTKYTPKELNELRIDANKDLNNLSHKTVHIDDGSPASKKSMIRRGEIVNNTRAQRKQTIIYNGQIVNPSGELSEAADALGLSLQELDAAASEAFTKKGQVGYMLGVPNVTSGSAYTQIDLEDGEKAQFVVSPNNPVEGAMRQYTEINNIIDSPEGKGIVALDNGKYVYVNRKLNTDNRKYEPEIWPLDASGQPVSKKPFTYQDILKKASNDMFGKKENVSLENKDGFINLFAD